MTTTENVQMFTTSDGTRVALHWHGPRDAPLTLVLAHGWTLDSRAWAPIYGPLCTDPGNVRVLCYDHRGHGRSDPAPPGTTTIAHLADDLAELLHTEIEGPVVLGGHSMGGMTIMGLAERHPELVAQRVLAAAFIATSGGNLRHRDFSLRPTLARLVTGTESRLMRAKWVSRLVRDREVTVRRAALIRPGVRWLLFGEYPQRADIAPTAQCMAEGRPANFVDFRPTFDDHERAAALAAFADIPVLVLAGTRDRLIPVHHSEEIAAQLPDAEFVRYAGAGHMVHLERANQVTTRLAVLLAQATNSLPTPGTE